MLAERVDELLDEVMASAGNETLIPAVAPLGLEDSARWSSRSTSSSARAR